MNNKVAYTVGELGPELRQVYFDIRTFVDSNDGTLPRIPEIIMSIDKALNDDDMTIEQIANIIKVDPTIAGRIIQIANSPLVRGSQQIDSLKVAISRIGLNFVRNLIFCMGMQDNYKRIDLNLKNQLLKSWEHSVEVMAVSYALGRKFREIDADTAMIVGIIHDIGYLPVFSYGCKQKMEQKDVFALANRLHVLLGIDIATKWDMSDIFKEAIVAHHNIDVSLKGPVSYANIVSLADIYATNYMTEDYKSKESIKQLLHKMAFTKESLADYLKETEAEIDTIKQNILG